MANYNIEISYFNGSSYDILYPKANFSNMNGSLTASQIPSLSASKITSGTFSTSQIPSLAASKITSGTFATARIPSLDMSKITTGNLPASRITGLSTSSLNYEDVNYIGTGTSGSWSNSTKITFSGMPVFIMITASSSNLTLLGAFGLGVYDNPIQFINGSTVKHMTGREWGNNYVEWYSSSDVYQLNPANANMTCAGITM